MLKDYTESLRYRLKSYHHEERVDLAKRVREIKLQLCSQVEKIKDELKHLNFEMHERKVYIDFDRIIKISTKKPVFDLGFGR